MMNKQCGACGTRQLAPFESESFEIEYKGRRTTVEGLSGLRCGACGEVLFDADGAQRYGAASDELVLAARSHEGEAIKKMRLKIGPTQAEASFPAPSTHATDAPASADTSSSPDTR